MAGRSTYVYMEFMCGYRLECTSGRASLAGLFAG